MKIKIEVTKKQIFVDGRKWSNRSRYFDLGDQIINILFYLNKDGKKDYQLTIEGVIETNDFKKEVSKKYSKGNLKHFCKYANC